MELLAVCHLDNANGVANRRQRLVADFNGYWIFVLQVNAVEQLAPNVVTTQDSELGLQVGTGAVSCGLHLRSCHLRVVPASRYGFEGFAWGDRGSIEIE